MFPKSHRLNAALMIVCALALVVVFRPLMTSSDSAHTWFVYVNVERDGKPVSGLGVSNFNVSLDGRSQPFEVQPVEPLASVVLLVERSQRSWAYVEDIRNAIDGFTSYAPEGNWYGLVTFGREAELVTDFTKNKREIASAFDALPPPQSDGIGTYDAIDSVLDKMTHLTGRRVILFIGSGFDTYSRLSFGDVERRLEATNVAIYSLAAGSHLRTRYDGYFGMSTDLDLLQARGFLTTLAEKSSGDAWFPHSENAFGPAMKAVMQDLATQYKLVVHGSIPTDGRFHKIKVDAFDVINDKRKAFKVRVRDGFRAD